MSQGYRSAPLPRGWQRIRLAVLRRDGWRCYLGPHAAAEVDHVVPESQGGGHELSNLAAICTPCHRDKTLRESGAVTDTRRRAPELHPGLTARTS